MFVKCTLKRLQDLTFPTVFILTMTCFPHLTCFYANAVNTEMSPATIPVVLVADGSGDKKRRWKGPSLIPVEGLAFMG